MPKIRPLKHQQAAEVIEAKPNRDLEKIAKEIRELEKRNLISAVIWIGERLYFADKELCGHGEYQDWIKREFGWSYRTALNYRNVYEFEKCHPDIFQAMNITLSALYYLAALDEGDEDDRVMRDAIIEAAKKGRVNYKMAVQIAQDAIAPDQETGKSEIVALLTEGDTPKIEELQGKVQEVIDKYDELIPAIEGDADDSEAEDNHCAECGLNAEQVQAAGHTLVKCVECNGLGSAYSVWRCTSCSQDEELAAKRTAKRNNGLATHYAQQFAKVAKFVKVVAEAGVWPEVIEQMGEERFRALVAQMQAALDGGMTDPVKAKADRAEAKARRQVH